MNARILWGVALLASTAQADVPVCGSDETCFIAFGDQGTGDAKQTRVATAMSEWAKNPKTRVDFLIGLGDNFYPVGVHGCDSGKFTTHFEDKYKDLDRHYYMSLGNHDTLMSFESKPEHQVCYAGKDTTRGPDDTSPKFEMPGLFYTFTRNDVQFFVIYTPGLTMQALWIRDGEHLKWLESELAKSRARWKIVYGHGPIFDYGQHGHSSMLAHKLLPLLSKYHVDAYFAGHEHNQQHLRHPSFPDIEFFVTGVAGQSGTKGYGPLTKWPVTERARTQQLELGFMYVRIGKDTMKVDIATVGDRPRATSVYSVTRPKQDGRAPVPPRLECAEPTKEKSMGLCYDKCRAGFDGVGPVCWKQCPSDYHDDGMTCRKDVDIRAKQHYGRGAGYPLWDENKCRRESETGCEKSGALWYPRCKRGFEAVGCCICRERTCPREYKDDGGTCRRDAHIFGKQSYGRGVGTVF